MHGWCVSGVMCYGNEWMNERVNEWIHERVGNVEWLCILLYFICICNMSLYLFMAILHMMNKPHIHPRTSVGNSSHRTRLVTYIYIYIYTYICVYVCMCVYIYVCVCNCCWKFRKCHLHYKLYFIENSKCPRNPFIPGLATFDVFITVVIQEPYIDSVVHVDGHDRIQVTIKGRHIQLREVIIPFNVVLH